VINTVLSDELKVTIGSETAQITYGQLLIIVILFIPDGVTAYFKSLRRKGVAEVTKNEEVAF
jgi:hypothetical protein